MKQFKEICCNSDVRKLISYTYIIIYNNNPGKLTIYPILEIK